MLLAVLEKRLDVRLFDQDVFINIAGGLKVDEPAADLAALCAVVSSFRNVPVDARTIVLGEVGLAGEIRSVSQLERRLSEAARLGFTSAVIPKFPRKRPAAALKMMPAATVAEALDALGLR